MTLEITVVCESIKRGCTFVAVMYDSTICRRFSASGATALEAVGWLFDEYIAVTRFGAGPSMARNADDVPGSRFARLERVVPARPTALTWVPTPAPTTKTRKRGKKAA